MSSKVAFWIGISAWSYLGLGTLAGSFLEIYSSHPMPLYGLLLSLLTPWNIFGVLWAFLSAGALAVSVFKVANVARRDKWAIAALIANGAFVGLAWRTLPGFFSLLYWGLSLQ